MRIQTHLLRGWNGTLLACFLFLANLAAGQGVIPFHRANSGLVDNHVNALTILQGAPLVATSKGVAWRQTDRWENFRSGENGLPDAPVTSAVVFGGNLWVGTFGKGLARWVDSRWKSFSQTDSGLNDDFVTCLAGWGSRLVVGTREGVSIFDGMLWNRLVLDGVTGPLQITCLAVGREVLLVGTAQGLYFVDSSLKSRVVDLGVSPTPWIQAVVVGSEFHFVAHDAGLAVLHPDGRQAMNGYDRSQVGRIFSLGTIERDVLCATNHGLIRVSPGAGVGRIQLPEFGVSGLAISALTEVGGEWYLGTNGNGVFRVPADRLSVGSGNLVSGGKEAPVSQIVTSGGVVSSSGAGATPLSGGTVSEPPLKLADVRIFPPPPAEMGTRNNSSSAPERPSTGTSGQPDANPDLANPFVKKPSDGGSNPGRPGTVPFWTLHKRPTKPSNLTYFKDVLPMVVKKCLACHTSGSGKYFPLNDPRMVVGYFRKAGMGRYEQFAAEGGGMFGVVDPADTELLQIWVGEGCKE